MLFKTLIYITGDVAIGLSPLRDSQLAKVLITLTRVQFNYISHYHLVLDGRTLNLVKKRITGSNATNSLILTKLSLHFLWLVDFRINWPSFLFLFFLGCI